MAWTINVKFEPDHEESWNSHPHCSIETNGQIAKLVADLPANAVIAVYCPKPKHLPLLDPAQTGKVTATSEMHSSLLYHHIGERDGYAYVCATARSKGTKAALEFAVDALLAMDPEHCHALHLKQRLDAGEEF